MIFGKNLGNAALCGAVGVLGLRMQRNQAELQVSKKSSDLSWYKPPQEQNGDGKYGYEQCDLRDVCLSYDDGNAEISHITKLVGPVKMSGTEMLLNFILGVFELYSAGKQNPINDISAFKEACRETKFEACDMISRLKFEAFSKVVKTNFEKYFPQNHCFDGFFLPSIQLEDASSVKTQFGLYSCICDDSICRCTSDYFPAVRKICTGNTWYESFGFVPKDQEDLNNYDETNRKFQEKSELSALEALRDHPELCEKVRAYLDQENLETLTLKELLLKNAIFRTRGPRDACKAEKVLYEIFTSQSLRRYLKSLSRKLPYEWVLLNMEKLAVKLDALKH